MKVSAQEIEQRQIVLEVEVDEERVQRALDQAYRRIVNRINVPGFRRGRAPRPLVERIVGREALLEDAVEHLIPEVYRDIVQERQIQPAGQPAVEVTSTEPLQFKATVPLQPRVELGDYRSIRVPLPPINVDESEIDAVIENLREANATWVPVERPVQIGDRVGLDVLAQRGERTVLNSSDAEFIVNPDGPEPMPGFSEKLVGAETGQELSFTLGGEGTETGGEPTVFTVRVHWVKEKELPTADDEFARSVGEKSTVEELRAEIRDQLRQHKEREARERQREEIIRAAVEQATVEIAPQMIERQAQHLLESFAARLDRQGISIEQYLQLTGKDESAFRSELMDEARRSLKRTLVLEAIAEAEGLTVSEEELRAEVERATQGARDPARTARQALARPETRAQVYSMVQTRKAVERLVALAGEDAEQPAETSASVASSGSAETVETNGETNG